MDPTKQKKISRYKSGIYAIILFAALSLINVFMLTFAGSYFLFSSYVSVLVIAILTEISQDFIWIALVITIILLIPYVICAIFAKKHFGFMITALILVGIDTLLLVGDMILSAAAGVFDTSFIMNLVFHVLAVIELILAVMSKDAVKFMKEGPSVNSVPDSVKTEVLPSGETVSVLEDTVVGSDNEVIDETSTEKRRITVNRKKCFYASMVKFDVVIDGVVVGTLKNGQSLSVMVSTGAHALYVQFSNGNSDVLQIPAQAVDKTYELKPVARAMDAFIEITEITEI